MLIIGIDPGLNTGIAISDEGVLIDLFSTDFWGCIEIINKYSSSLFVIEIPQTKTVWHSGFGSESKISTIGVNVGSVLRESKLIVDFFNKNKLVYFTQKPRKKLNRNQFNLLTNWNGVTK